MNHTRERGRTIDFSLACYAGGLALLVRKDSATGGVADLAGERFAAMA